MLEEFSITNFKAFAEKQRIPLKPITLIFGANSCGKSSILQSLVWAKHALHSGKLDFDAIGPSGDEIELGGIENVLFKKDTSGRIHLEFMLPRGTISDYRITFEIGVWTPELKKKHFPEPIPPDEIRSWFDAQSEFLEAEQMAHDEYLHAPFARDEKGDFIYKDKERFDRLEWWEVRGEPYRSDYREEAKEKWKPQLEELWKKWREENEKPGVREKLEQFDARHLLPYYEMINQDDSNPEIFNFEIAIEGHLLLRAERNSFDDGLTLTHLSKSIQSFREYTVDDLEIPDGWPEPPENHSATITRESDVSGMADLWKEGAWISDDLGESLQILFLGLRPSIARARVSPGERETGALQGRSRRPHWGSPEVLDSLQWVITDCRNRLEKVLSETTYLGPLRTLPPRTFFSFEPRGKSSAGEEAWARLRDDEKLRNKINQWIGADRLETGYSFEREVFTEIGATMDALEWDRTSFGDTREWDLDRNSFEEGFERRNSSNRAPTYHEDGDEAVSYWAERLPRVLRNLILRDSVNKVEVTHHDVGVGISQLIPIVVHALAESNATIAVEQPEIHLHPALQAKLGDLFIHGALREGRNRFLLETHSEHLILRILRRIRETSADELPEGEPSITPEDVCVLYVQRSENGSEIIELPVTEDGDFSKPWPKGFFTERAEELF